MARDHGTDQVGIPIIDASGFEVNVPQRSFEYAGHPEVDSMHWQPGDGPDGSDQDDISQYERRPDGKTAYEIAVNAMRLQGLEPPIPGKALIGRAQRLLDNETQQGEQ